MKYTVGRPNDEGLYAVLPDYQRHWLETAGCVIVYAGTPNIVSELGLFRTKGKIAELLYLYIDPGIRSFEDGSDLIRFSEDYLAVMGVTHVKGFAYEEELMGDEKDIVSWLRRAGYTESKHDGVYLEYTLDMLKKTVFSNKIDQMENLVKRVAYHNELSEETIHDMEEEAEQNNMLVDTRDVDLLFARYYMENGVIKGFMDWREIEENKLFLVNTFIATGKEQQFYFPGMLAAFVEISENTMPDETKVMFSIYSPEAYKGVRTVFGNPLFEKQLHLFEKNI